jgi:dodecin
VARGSSFQDDQWRLVSRLEVGMSSVARITQISARSENGFEDAVRVGIDRANATLRNVTGAWVKDQKVEVQDGQISAYQVVLEVTFVLD